MLVRAVGRCSSAACGLQQSSPQPLKKLTYSLLTFPKPLQFSCIL